MPLPIAPRPTFVLLLNADAEIVGDALWQMATFLHERPAAGACGAICATGMVASSMALLLFHRSFRWRLTFFPLTGWPGVQRLHNSRWNGRYPAQLWQGTTPFPVDFVLGAALMVRGAAIQQVGGLDDAFFLYCEEMDWCMRLEEAGWPIYAVPTAYVIHYEAQSSSQVRWAAYERLWRSRFRFYAKHRRVIPAGYLALLRVLVHGGLRSSNGKPSNALPMAKSRVNRCRRNWLLTRLCENYRRWVLFNLVAVILTKDEAPNIADCIASLRDWVDAVMVWDAISADDTCGGRSRQAHWWCSVLLITSPPSARLCWIRWRLNGFSLSMRTNGRRRPWPARCAPLYCVTQRPLLDSPAKFYCRPRNARRRLFP